MEKAAKRAEKQQRELEEMQRLGPICEEHVGKGLDHVLGLKVGERREILKIHFGLSSFEVAGVDVPLYKLNKAGTEAAIRSLIVAVPALPLNVTNVTESGGSGNEGDNDVDGDGGDNNIGIDGVVANADG